MAFLAAALVLLVGLILAVVVLEPRPCGMDEFDCSPNMLRYLTGLASVLVAIVIVALGLAAHDD
jgi:hypothetical protein